MATYSGSLLKGFDTSFLDDYNPVIREDRTSPVVDPSGLAPAETESAPKTNGQPIDIRNVPHSAVRLRSFFEDYYNRIYFLPALVDFGPVSGDISRDVRVWNAHFYKTTLIEIIATNAGGINLSGPSLPKLFKALEIVTYEFQATTDGPPSIDATFAFNFEHEGTYGTEGFNLPLIGRRARISPLKPNWRESFRITYEFKTEIITSHLGKEQRRALRSTPRKKIEFLATANRAVARLMNENMAFWHSRTLLLPERPREAPCGAGMPAGVNFIVLDDAAPSWAQEGAIVMLVWREIEEPRTIVSVEDNVVTFDSVSDTEFPSGVKMIFTVSGTFPVTLESKRYTNEVFEVSVVFNVTPTSEIKVPVGLAPVVFNSREVFMTKPNWGGNTGLTYEQLVEEVDFGRGKTARFLPIEFETRIRKFEYIGRSFAEADATREFFDRMKGQRGEFYMPTWENDLIPGVATPQGGNFLRITGLSIYDNYVNDTVHRALIVFPHIGEPMMRRIQSIYRIDDEIGTDTGIQVDAPWPIEISQDTVRQICWMPVWRMASDSLTMEWKTNSVAQYALSMRSLEDL